MKHTSSKLLTGFSACFRQHKADSHCKFLHGYALEFKILFGANELDEKNWVVDFGAFKDLRAIMENLFDHKTVIANDDPQREMFKNMAAEGIIELRFLKAVGCEAFAKEVFELCQQMFENERVKVIAVTCREHGINEASYWRTPAHDLKWAAKETALLILGGPRTGKTEFAKKITKGRNTVWIGDMNEWKKNIQRDTELIIFDGVCNDIIQMKQIATMKEFRVRPPYAKEAAEFPMPGVIFISNSIKKEDVADARHFTVIDLNVAR